MDIGRLVVTLVQYDDDLYCEAVAECGGYRGEAPFWAPRAQLDDFVAQLAQLDARLDGEASLDCRWVSDEGGIQLRIAPWGHSGRLTVTVALTSDNQWHHARLAFVVMPNALTAFRRELAALLDARAGSASLVGDREAAGY